MARNTINLGTYRLDTDPDRLWRGSEEVPLRAKSLSVLAYLARRPGRLVTKDELREQVWGATHVSDTTLRVTVREIRAALGDDTTSSRYLETVPGRGYRFVPDPEASSGLVSAEGQGAKLPSVNQGEPIVGRQREIEDLLNRFLEADKGRRQLVFLAGEPGVGKTALVQLFMERLTGRPGTTLVGGQCVMSFGVGEAYGPVLEVLGRMANGPAGAALIRLLDRCAPMWLVQLPAVVESAELERLQHRVEGATQERMVRELNDALERLTTQATLVLVLEDLHWSDVATVDLLTSIAQRPEAARLMIVGTYRPADAVVSNPTLLEAIRELRRRAVCEHLDVELLTRRDVGTYVAARLGGTDSEDVADQVFESSEGNALFMVNVLDHLLQEQALRRLGDRWIVYRQATALRRIPKGLRPFILQRLETLSTEERLTLETASVVGVEFDVAALAPGTSPADLRQDLERLEPGLEALANRSRLIEGCGVTEWPDGILSARYRFHHALYRKGLYDEIPEARRARLHRMIGEHLRAAFGPEDASLASVLAVHFEIGQDAESAARYRRMAGERALGRHAYHEATQHFQKALDAFDQAHTRPAADGNPEDLVRWELEVCMALGTALNVAMGYTTPEVWKIYSRARLLIERLVDPMDQVPVLFNLWSFSTASADLAKSTSLVTQMSELAAAKENDELALMSSCAKARTALFRGKLAESADAARHVFTLYDPLRHRDLFGRHGRDDAGAATLGGDAWCLWLQGYPAQAVARAREACELAKRYDKHTRAYAEAWLLATLQFRGETAQLERRTRALHRLTAENDFPFWFAWATFFEGWVAGARGTVAEGIALMERGLDAWRGTGARIIGPYQLALLAESCLRAGRIDAASERLAEARARVEKTDERWWEAELHRLEGEVLLAAAEDGGRDRDSSVRAEACFQSALEVARGQQARSLELRAALSLSRLWSRSRSDEARRVLGGVLETFTEGHDTADLRAAGEQMAQLSRVD